MDEEKCPLRMVSGDLSEADCMKEKCAWYLPAEGRCAVVLLAEKRATPC